MRILLSCLALSFSFAAFSDDSSLEMSECSPVAEEQAECFCHHLDFEDWVLGLGETYEEAAQTARGMCKLAVRFTLIEKRGFSEAEADQYDYSSHITSRCRPTNHRFSFFSFCKQEIDPLKLGQDFARRHH